MGTADLGYLAPLLAEAQAHVGVDDDGQVSIVLGEPEPSSSLAADDADLDGWPVSHVV